MCLKKYKSIIIFYMCDNNPVVALFVATRMTVYGSRWLQLRA